MKYLILIGTLTSMHAYPQLHKIKAGSLQVGFLSLTRYDSARTAVKEQAIKDKGRIIQINIWYPAISVADKMSFDEYVGLAGLELDSSKTNNWKETGINVYFSWPASLKANKEKFIDFILQKIPTTAGKHSGSPVKKYPLVMLVHGFAADHAYLAEYLASHGYIVLHVPVKGSVTYELDYEEKGLESQVLDYEFGWNVLKREFPFITSEAVVTGFSFGGQSAMALALRNKEVKCIVSLDGGLGSAFGVELLKSQSYYNPAEITQPILHVYNPKDPYTNLAWLKTVPRSKRCLAAMKNMEHGHFTSFGILDKVVPGIMGEKAPDPGHGYEAVMCLTLQFIKATLKSSGIPGDDFFNAQKARHPWITNTIEKEEVIS